MEINITQVTVLTKITTILKKLMALLVLHQVCLSRNGTFYCKESQMTYLFYFTRNLRKTQRVMWVYFFQVISRKFPYALRLKLF